MGDPHVIEKVATVTGLMVVAFGVWLMFHNTPVGSIFTGDVCKTDNAIAVKTYYRPGYVCVKNTAITEVN